MNRMKKMLPPALLLLFLTVSPALAGKAAVPNLQQEIDRFIALGAEYDALGFPQMKAQKTPFGQYHRVDTGRLMGRVVYSVPGRVRIWKTIFCGNMEVIFLELSLRDRTGRRIPFAWQDCLLVCDHGGVCDGNNALYVDLDGDGRPEIRFPKINAVSHSAMGPDRAIRRDFTKDILPSWVKAAVGPDFANLYPLGPDQRAPFGEDHPTTLEDKTMLRVDD